MRCAAQGFESEEDYFRSDLTLGQWVRDARLWAEQLLLDDRENCSAMFEAAGGAALKATDALFRRELVADLSRLDDFDAADTLIKWARSAELEAQIEYARQKSRYGRSYSPAYELAPQYQNHQSHIVGEGKIRRRARAKFDRGKVYPTDRRLAATERDH